MKTLEIMPQNKRLTALLLGLVGGCLDIFSYHQFGNLITTQTGNILLLISDFRTSALDRSLYRILSIIFFTIGFLICKFLREKAKTAYWRTYGLLPLLLSTFIYPFFSQYSYFWVIILASSVGIMMLAFTNTQIENHPYAIMMTSGNYRKMISAWDTFIRHKEKRPILKRQAINYTIVVFSFVIGALLTNSLYYYCHQFSIWSVTIILALIAIYYSVQIYIWDLKDKNI